MLIICSAPHGSLGAGRTVCRSDLISRHS